MWARLGLLEKEPDYSRFQWLYLSLLSHNKPSWRHKSEVLSSCYNISTWLGQSPVYKDTCWLGKAQRQGEDFQNSISVVAYDTLCAHPCSGSILWPLQRCVSKAKLSCRNVRYYFKRKKQFKFKGVKLGTSNKWGTINKAKCGGKITDNNIIWQSNNC